MHIAAISVLLEWQGKKMVNAANSYNFSEIISIFSAALQLAAFIN